MKIHVLNIETSEGIKTFLSYKKEYLKFHLIDHVRKEWEDQYEQPAPEDITDTDIRIYFDDVAPSGEYYSYSTSNLSEFPNQALYPTILTPYQKIIVDLLLDQLGRILQVQEWNANVYSWIDETIDMIEVSISGNPDGTTQEEFYQNENPLSYNEIVEAACTRIHNCGMSLQELQTLEDLKTTETQPEPVYLLLGEEPCRKYAEEGIDSLTNSDFENLDGHYEAVYSIDDALSVADGWNEYAILSKEEYDKLNS